MTAMHVIPRRDLIEHQASEDCACGPNARPEKRDDGSVGWVIVHHSLDGREQRDGCPAWALLECLDCGSTDPCEHDEGQR